MIRQDFNLFSLTKMMKSGWSLGGSYKEGITLSKGIDELNFDIPIETPMGIVYAIDIKRIKHKVQIKSVPKKDKKKKVSKTKRAKMNPSCEETKEPSKAPDDGWIVVKPKRATSNVQEKYTDSNVTDEDRESVGHGKQNNPFTVLCDDDDDAFGSVEEDGDDNEDADTYDDECDTEEGSGDIDKDEDDTHNVQDDNTNDVQDDDTNDDQDDDTNVNLPFNSSLRLRTHQTLRPKTKEVEPLVINGFIDDITSAQRPEVPFVSI
jgi:hypothetical protein